MTGFKIVSLTKVGSDALDVCIQEEKRELLKKSFLDRMKFKKIWIRKTERIPLTVDSWTVHPDALRFLQMDKNWSIERIVSEVIIAMQLNGAENTIDYFIEVES